MKKRIIGIDVSRALAVFGMVIVNFKIVFGEHGDSWIKPLAGLFDGKAAATFVVLAGVGLALMTNSAKQDPEKWNRAKNRIIKRSFFLFAVGLSYYWIWPADILHFYGIYMLVTLLFLKKNGTQILTAVTGFILLFPLLLLFVNYEAGWNFSTLEYLDFLTIEGFLRNLFFNGFHPVIPWTAFMLFGVWLGKQNLNDDQFVKKSLWISSIVFILIQIISYGSILLLSGGNEESIKELTELMGTDPMPPMPFYMINGLSIATVVISSCILLGKKFEESKIVEALNKTGQLALTFYVAHVVIGIGIVEEFSSTKLGEFAIEFSVLYALAFNLLCIQFSIIWLRYKKAGPLEWIMRKMTD